MERIKILYIRPCCESHFIMSDVFLGTLHVGDEIREINNVSVVNQTVESLQKMLVSVQAMCRCH